MFGKSIESSRQGPSSKTKNCTIAFLSCINSPMKPAPFRTPLMLFYKRTRSQYPHAHTSLCFFRCSNPNQNVCSDAQSRTEPSPKQSHSSSSRPALFKSLSLRSYRKNTAKCTTIATNIAPANPAYIPNKCGSLYVGFSASPMTLPAAAQSA